MIKCEEKGKKYVLENTQGNHCIVYHMDDGIIKMDESVLDGTNKCDYLFVLNGSTDSLILIELKGKANDKI